MACHYANNPNVGVFRDLLVEWDIPGQKDHCPDTFVAFGISNKDQERSKFIVANEGVRPVLVLEVVSPNYRKEDREIKVIQYARTGVQEYVIVDRRRQKGKLLEEVLGYRLIKGIYQPIAPDSQGRIYCQTVGLLMSLQSGCLVIEDANTGKRVLSSLELEIQHRELKAIHQKLKAAKELAQQQAAEMEAARELAQQQAAEMEAAKELAQQQVAEMAELLKQYQKCLGELPE
ncbi:MAG: hypothetical protein F6K47_39590 [Symploca sp. SIO2E6]|nr:hypothetical protein [Symploca sp. SIO2E6]